MRKDRITLSQVSKNNRCEKLRKKEKKSKGTLSHLKGRKKRIKKRD